MELTAEQETAKNGHERQGNGRCATHRKGLGKSEWVKELSLLPCQRKHRHKGENDNRHREECRTSAQFRGAQDRLEDASSIAGIDAFQMSKGIFGNDYPRVDQHSDSDSNTRKRHHIRGDMGVVHEEEGAEHGEWQRQSDYEDAAEVH